MHRAGLILAGGRSSRMGMNKALITLGGKAVVSRVADALVSVSSDVVVAISQNMDPLAYRGVLPREVRIVVDKMRINSPLVGIVSGLSEFPPCHCAVLSCDLPFVAPKVLLKLYDEVEGFDAAIPQWADGRIEPVHSVYNSVKAVEAAKKALEKWGLSNRDMLKNLRHLRLVSTESLRSEDPELLTFFNMNSPLDLKRAERIIQHL